MWSLSQNKSEVKIGFLILCGWLSNRTSSCLSLGYVEGVFYHWFSACPLECPKTSTEGTCFIVKAQGYKHQCSSQLELPSLKYSASVIIDHLKCCPVAKGFETYWIWWHLRWPHSALNILTSRLWLHILHTYLLKEGKIVINTCCISLIIQSSLWTQE